jgi:pilus assembly protein Flp/PilA
MATLSVEERDMKSFREYLSRRIYQVPVEEGQGMVEYALILALVSVVAITILMGLGTNVQAIFSSASSALGTAI